MPAHRSAALSLLLLGTAAAADLPEIQLHGLLSQGYLRTSGNDWLGATSGRGTFEFNELALNVLAQPVDGVRIGVQLISRDMGDSGNNRVEIDWAYADWRPRQEIGLSVGRVKTPFGLYNEARDLDVARTAVFLPICVYQVSFRDQFLAVNGGKLHGRLELGGAGDLSWAAYGGGLSTRLDSDLAKEFENQAGRFTPSLASADTTGLGVDHAVGACLAWYLPVRGLQLRGSVIQVIGLEAGIDTTGQESFLTPGYLADNRFAVSIARYTAGMLSLEYQANGFTAAGEWFRDFGRADLEVLSTSHTSVPVPGIPGGTTRVDLPPVLIPSTLYTKNDAFYLSLGYRFLDRFELAVSRQQRFFNRDEPGAGYLRVWSLAGRIDLTTDWLFKVEYQWCDGTELLHRAENPAGLADRWSILACKTTIDF